MGRAGGLTADELLGSLRRRRAALPAEIGTFIVFEACEAALKAPPALVSAAAVRVHQEGGIQLLPGAASASEEACARSLHALLARLLLSAQPGPSPALLRLLEQGPSTGSWSREALRDDLEAALVPLNRLASRRVLARLLREVAADRARDQPPAPSAPSYAELDAELGALLSDTSSAKEPFREDEPTLREEVLLVEELAFEERDDFHERPTMKLSSPPLVEPPAMAHAHGDTHAHVYEDAHPRHATPRLGLWLGVALVALAGGLVALVGWLRPEVFSRLRGERVEAAAPEVVAAAPEPPGPARVPSCCASSRRGARSCWQRARRPWKSGGSRWAWRRSSWRWPRAAHRAAR